MPVNIVAFPTAEDRFFRIVDRLEAIASHHPYLAQEASAIAKELEHFVRSVDRELEGAYKAIKISRTSETRAVAWCQAVNDVCDAEIRNEVQHAYERRLAAI